VQQFLAHAGLPRRSRRRSTSFAAIPAADDGHGVGRADRRAQLAGLQLLLHQERRDLGHGRRCPDILQFGQNNTQTAAASRSAIDSRADESHGERHYSRTTSNDHARRVRGARSNNCYRSAGLVTPLGPKTSASFGAKYTRFIPVGIVETNTTSS
jgi:hypothetical protein